MLSIAEHSTYKLPQWWKGKNLPQWLRTGTERVFDVRRTVLHVFIYFIYLSFDLVVYFFSSLTVKSVVVGVLIGIAFIWNWNVCTLLLFFRSSYRLLFSIDGIELQIAVKVRMVKTTRQVKASRTNAITSKKEIVTGKRRANPISNVTLRPLKRTKSHAKQPPITSVKRKEASVRLPPIVQQSPAKRMSFTSREQHNPILHFFLVQHWFRNQSKHPLRNMHRRFRLISCLV